jgi:hypothetical protein
MPTEGSIRCAVWHSRTCLQPWFHSNRKLTLNLHFPCYYEPLLREKTEVSVWIRFDGTDAVCRIYGWVYLISFLWNWNHEETHVQTCKGDCFTIACLCCTQTAITRWCVDETGRRMVCVPDTQLALGMQVRIGKKAVSRWVYLELRNVVCAKR